jgi:hypothetical protein
MREQAGTRSQVNEQKKSATSGSNQQDGPEERTMRTRTILRMALLGGLVVWLSLGCGGNSDDAGAQQEALPACLPPGDYVLEWTAVTDSCGPDCWPIRHGPLNAGCVGHRCGV